jgi:hypothetical protein
MPTITPKRLREIARKRIEASGLSERQFALEIGTSPQQLNAFLNKRQGPGSVATALGYKQVMRFIPVEDE